MTRRAGSSQRRALRAFARKVRCTLAAAGAALCGAAAASAQPLAVRDLADVPVDGGGLLRLAGSVGTGTSGLPVAGGLDMNADGYADVAMASMRAAPDGRSDAGIVYLLLGDGRVDGLVDTGVPNPNVLEIHGDGATENSGSEIWMDDVTGDGMADLLIARQNYTPAAGREGAGALTILAGSPALAAQAQSGIPIDLRSPPAYFAVVTFVGAVGNDRLGIWMRTGDVTGDGIADIAVGADQASAPGETHRGEVYLIRGGAGLASTRTVDLADFGATALAGGIARLRPPPGADHFHFGATCQIADLDGDGRGEVLAAAALNRAGAALSAAGSPVSHAVGGPPRGALYIAWADLFAADPWPAGYTHDMGSTPASETTLRGGADNDKFGEEILGGLDYDADGRADLFVGDLTGSPPGRVFAGIGHILFGAGALRGRDLDVDALPAGVETTTYWGASAGDIGADTAAHGDFDGDGIADLVFSAPHASPAGRTHAGIVYLIAGKRTGWQALVDLSAGAYPRPAQQRIIEVHGANGGSSGDAGDTLSYSAAAGDVDGDGRIDLITNEMVGNGVAPGAVDVGNLIVLSGAGLLAPPSVPAAGAEARIALAAGLAVLALTGLRRKRCG